MDAKNVLRLMAVFACVFVGRSHVTPTFSRKNNLYVLEMGWEDMGHLRVALTYKYKSTKYIYTSTVEGLAYQSEYLKIMCWY